MHKKTFLFVILLLLSTTLFARPNFYFNTSISKPFSPESFLSQWRSGYEVGAATGFMLSEHFEIVPGIHYNNFAMDDQAFLNDYLGDDNVYASVSGGTAHIFDVSLDAKYLVPSKSLTKITPYVIAGGGFAHYVVSEKEIITAGATSLQEQEKTNAAMLGGGIGFEFVMGGNTFFVVEGRFNVILGNETTVFAPLKIGIIIK